MSHEAVLLMTHFLGGPIPAAYARLSAEAGPGRDVWVLYNRSDAPPGDPPAPEGWRVFPFHAADLRALGFPHKGRRLSAWDVELFVLLFARRNPSYRYVWGVEYDVAFTGRWSTLFDAFADSPADLLATTIHRYPVHPAWENWKTVRTPAGRPRPDSLLRAFMPCHRLSRRGVLALEQGYAEGWAGHYEATVPTVIARAGLILEDIGGDGEFVAPGNRNRFYTNTPSADSLAPGSFVFRPARATPGAEPDRLWHPVKPDRLRGGWATGRRARLARWVRGLFDRADGATP